MNLNLFIARRLYLDRGDAKRVSRPAIHIAAVGVAVGLAVMIVSVCVVLGFKREIRTKVMGFGAHIQVLEYGALAGKGQMPVAITPDFMRELSGTPGVKHAQRYSVAAGILKTDEDFKGIQLRGVGPEYDTSFLKANLTEGELPVFSDTVASNGIVISQKTADELRLTVGSRVFAYFFDNNVRTRRFTVIGIYRTNLTEFDNTLVFTDIYTCGRLNGWDGGRYSGVELTVNDVDSIDDVAVSLMKSVNRRTDEYGAVYSTVTIRELYPQIFAWLDLLDMNVWVILVLMTAVAGFTMISGLLILILERTNFIGVMKALGATNRSMRRIFLYFAAFIIGRGLLWGNIIGIGLVALQHFFGVFHLDASTYYVEVVPVLFNPWLVLAINVATLVISVLVLVVPSFLISHIHPARSIRFE